VSPIECICCYLRTCDKTPTADLLTLDRVLEAVQRAADGPAAARPGLPT
jgi:hypothetical protein